jgi:hypothetical protein
MGQVEKNRLVAIRPRVASYPSDGLMPGQAFAWWI